MTIDPDELASLEEERTFLLASLRDLEREHDAGDIDDVDYVALRDGYTARAAAALRALEAGEESLPARRPTSWRRRLIVLGTAVVAIGVVSAVLVATMSERSAGQTASGFDPRTEEQQLLAQARALQASDPAAAVELYGQVLDSEPDNVEALTYQGWTQMIAVFQSGAAANSDESVAKIKAALESLTKATELDPAYPDPHCFLAVSYANFLQRPELAQPEIDACLEAGPPADVRGMVEGLKARIDAELGTVGAASSTASATS